MCVCFFFARKIIVLEFWVVAPGKERSFCIILHELVLCDLVKGSESWKNDVVACNHMPLLQKKKRVSAPIFLIVGENCFGMCASGAKDKITVGVQFCT